MAAIAWFRSHLSGLRGRADKTPHPPPRIAQIFGLGGIVRPALLRIMRPKRVHALATPMKATNPPSGTNGFTVREKIATPVFSAALPTAERMIERRMACIFWPSITTTSTLNSAVRFTISPGRRFREPGLTWRNISGLGKFVKPPYGPGWRAAKGNCGVFFARIHRARYRRTSVIPRCTPSSR
jgi:hypothetical protein